MQNRLVTTVVLLMEIALATLPGHGQPEAVSLTRQGDSIQVAIGGKPFTTYRFDPKIAKAFLQPLRDANGVVGDAGLSHRGYSTCRARTRPQHRAPPA